jgi:hypothetical protein
MKKVFPKQLKNKTSIIIKIKNEMELKVILTPMLWINETYFDETEKKFCGLMEDHSPTSRDFYELFKVEIDI